MTRQEQFKAELFELFLKYEVEMSVVENTRCGPIAEGINFWSYAKYDSEHNMIADVIDLTVGMFENGKE